MYEKQKPVLSCQKGRANNRNTAMVFHPCLSDSQLPMLEKNPPDFLSALRAALSLILSTLSAASRTAASDLSEAFSPSFSALMPTANTAYARLGWCPCQLDKANDAKCAWDIEKDAMSDVDLLLIRGCKEESDLQYWPAHSRCQLHS